jgi:hypothetical protein
VIGLLLWARYLLLAALIALAAAHVWSEIADARDRTRD